MCSSDPRMSVKSLKEEILNKKRKLEELGIYKQQKYVKRAELEQERIKQYLEEQKKIEEKRKMKEEAKLKERSAVSPPRQQPANEQKKETLNLPRREVKKRLRARGEPITLFGETDEERAERLRQLELKEPMEYVEGVGSEFVKSIKEENEEGDDPEMLKHLKQEQEEEKEFKEDGKEPTCDEEKVWYFFRRLLREWGQQLDARPELEKKTAQGKYDTATYRQTRTYIKPFFVQCRKRTVPDEILKDVTAIVAALEERDYVKANDAYYRMAIGNAPWPMGVTMVGIHERSAREKIFSNQVAHVLNDETQRKYIQAIKRLMTFCQKQYPTVPSRSVG